MKRILFVFAAVFILASAVQSQNVEGTWNGFFIVLSGNAKVQYRDTIRFSVEIFKENGKTACTTYSRKGDFIGIAEAKFKFDSSRQKARIIETKFISVSEKGAATEGCLMVCDLRYRKSGEREEMIGRFTSKNKDARDCGEGEIYIRKAKEEIQPEK